MIDIHCHILPGVDDGPQHLNSALTMARVAAEDGISTIIATPHTDGIRVNRNLVEDKVLILNNELASNQIALKIVPGYEIPYHLVPDLAKSHTLVNSNYILIEFPHTYLPRDALGTVYSLVDQGLQPIIAHPERNGGILQDPGQMEDLIAAGALSQLTASSVTGEQGPDVQRCANYLLVNNMAHFIATDSHSPSFRIPVLSKAHAIAVKLLGKTQADYLTIGNPEKILQVHN